MDYFEKINMNIITDLISKEVKSSLVKEKFFKNNVYNKILFIKWRKRKCI